MFNRNVYLEEADITSVARFVISVIEDNDTIHLRFYSASLLPSQLTDGSWNNKGNLEEVGAKIDLKILRKSLAEESIYKRAVKYQPYWAEKKVYQHFLTSRRKISNILVSETKWEEYMSNRLI